MFDTVKGGDYLVDQDAAEVLAREAIETVIELEHMGLPFNRTADGKIDQRRFGGHTSNYGEAPVRRACFAADRTGHMILQTLYQQCIKHGVKFFDEYQVVDLLFEGGEPTPAGARPESWLSVSPTASCTLSGPRPSCWPPAASGGCSASRPTPTASPATAWPCATATASPQDMEFFQFHPTGIVGIGILLSEAARGEGGTLLNDLGERFMERYAPKLMELAPRDMVSRAMYQEIRAGRGIGGKDYLYLDVRHLGRKVIEEKLPDITDFARIYQGVEPLKEPVPVQPTAHYAMGGIPTNVSAEVMRDEKGTVVPGLFAAGECACVSVHGANRLGTNSLVDLLVFGRRAGRQMARYAGGVERPRPIPDAVEPVRAELEAIRTRPSSGESAAAIRTDLQDVMMDNVGVYRDGKMLTAALARVRELEARHDRISITDCGSVFNTELLEAREDSDTSSTLRTPPFPVPWLGPRAAAPIHARTTPSATTRSGSSTLSRTEVRTGRRSGTRTSRLPASNRSRGRTEVAR